MIGSLYYVFKYTYAYKCIHKHYIFIYIFLLAYDHLWS